MFEYNWSQYSLTQITHYLKQSYKQVKVVEWLTRSPANLVKRMPSGAQVRILSLTNLLVAILFFPYQCKRRLEVLLIIMSE
jgi:hypothetical protein